MLIGQNMVMNDVPPYHTWEDAMKVWEDEKVDFKYGELNDKAEAYVQVGYHLHHVLDLNLFLVLVPVLVLLAILGDSIHIQQLIIGQETIRV